MLTLDQATIKFGGLTAVDHVSFTVEKGQIFGVIGPNGAGKTTLFNLVSGVHKLTSGTITFNGVELGKLEPYQIANHQPVQQSDGAGKCQNRPAHQGKVRPCRSDFPDACPEKRGGGHPGEVHGAAGFYGPEEKG